MSVYCYIQDGAVLDCFFLPKNVIYLLVARVDVEGDFFSLGLFCKKWIRTNPESKQEVIEFWLGEVFDKKNHLRLRVKKFLRDIFVDLNKIFIQFTKLIDFGKLNPFLVLQ